MKRHAENLISDHVMCVYKVTRIDRYALHQTYLRYDWPTSLESLWYMFCPSGFAVAVVKIGRYAMGPMVSRLQYSSNEFNDIFNMLLLQSACPKSKLPFDMYLDHMSGFLQKKTYRFTCVKWHESSAIS